MVNTTKIKKEKRADSIRLYLKCQLTNAMRYEQIEKFDFEHIIVNTQKNELYEQKMDKATTHFLQQIIKFGNRKLYYQKVSYDASVFNTFWNINT